MDITIKPKLPEPIQAKQAAQAKEAVQPQNATSDQMISPPQENAIEKGTGKLAKETGSFSDLRKDLLHRNLHTEIHNKKPVEAKEEKKEEKVEAKTESTLQKDLHQIDQEIELLTKRIQDLQERADDSGSIDVQTMKLQRLLDKRANTH